MSIEQIVNFLKWLFSGDGKDGVEPFLRNPHALLLVFVFALLLWTGDLIRRGSMQIATATFLLAALLGGGFYALQRGAVPVTSIPPRQQTAEAPPPARPPIAASPPVAQDAPPEAPRPANIAAFAIYDGETLIGGDLRSAADLRQQRISRQACEKRCADDMACLAFTFDKAEESCILKGAVTERKPLANVLVGVRRGGVSLVRP